MRACDSEFVSVHITVLDAALAERLARRLVEERCAACVNIVSGVRSVYRWQGGVEQGDELLLIAKTRAERLSEVERVVLDEHSDEVPCLVALPLVAGHDAYLDWVTAQLRRD